MPVTVVLTAPVTLLVPVLVTAPPRTVPLVERASVAAPVTVRVRLAPADEARTPVALVVVPIRVVGLGVAR